MLFSKRQSSKETVRIYCPVCPALLGTKYKDEIKSFKCVECLHTFYFYANGRKKPRGVKTKTLEGSRCNCGRCGR